MSSATVVIALAVGLALLDTSVAKSFSGTDDKDSGGSALLSGPSSSPREDFNSIGNVVNSNSQQLPEQTPLSNAETPQTDFTDDDGNSKFQWPSGYDLKDNAWEKLGIKIPPLTWMQTFADGTTNNVPMSSKQFDAKSKPDSRWELAGQKMGSQSTGSNSANGYKEKRIRKRQARSLSEDATSRIRKRFQRSAGNSKYIWSPAGRLLPEEVRALLNSRHQTTWYKRSIRSTDGTASLEVGTHARRRRSPGRWSSLSGLFPVGYRLPEYRHMDDDLFLDDSTGDLYAFEKEPIRAEKEPEYINDYQSGYEPYRSPGGSRQFMSWHDGNYILG